MDGEKTLRDANLAKEKERMATLNLAALQRLDDKIVKVLGNAGHVALYSFDADKQEWVRRTASLQQILTQAKRNGKKLKARYLLQRGTEFSAYFSCIDFVGLDPFPRSSK